MKYNITCPNPLSHMLRIRAEFEVEPYAHCTFHLPLWRPGRYEAANYARNMRNLSFESGTGEVLTATKPRVSTWRVTANGDGRIIAHYEYFAFQLDAGASYVDDELTYINFVNCLLYDPMEMKRECILYLDLPNDYQAATSLRMKEDVFKARDYYELADSPLLAASSLDHLSYKCGKTTFHLWFWGYKPEPGMVDEFKKFTESQLAMMREFPEKEYHFLNLILPYKFYHGVEHGASTVICLGPNDKMETEDLKDQLIGISSHELFHAWNILKIRPRELFPYKFHEPAYFPTGFVAEGFTTYYGDLFLVRSGVRDLDWYLKELERLFKRHFDNHGRLSLSVVDSSYDLWIDGYQKSAPSRKSSIYVEGAMAALMLDLTIRKSSGDQRSLDDAVRTLFTEYAQRSRGYTLEDIRRITSEAAESDLTDFFDRFVNGTEEKFDLLKALLSEAALDLTMAASTNEFEKYTGIRTSEINGNHKIVQIYPDSPAEEKFSLDDEVQEVNGTKFNATDFRLTPGEATFRIKRMNRIVNVILPVDEGASFFPVPKLKLLENAPEDAVKRREKWMRK